MQHFIVWGISNEKGRSIARYNENTIQWSESDEVRELKQDGTRAVTHAFITMRCVSRMLFVKSELHAEQCGLRLEESRQTENGIVAYGAAFSAQHMKAARVQRPQDRNRCKESVDCSHPLINARSCRESRGVT